MTTPLAPCPCGATPSKLCVSPGQTYRWRWAVGECCGEWHIEVRVSYPDDDAAIYAKCVAAWNETPREDKGKATLG